MNSLLKSTISDVDSSRKFSQLENDFNKQKSEFTFLLRNPAKNSLHREVVQNANKNGIMIIEHNNSFRVFISQDMINEALLLSDMFNLNELSALELLITGENQLSRYPNMTRGTIAVFYYYDGRLSMVNALKTLLEARNGRTWTSKVSRDMSRFISKYTDELKSDNIIARCIDILGELDVVAQFEMLEKNRALGPPTYRKRVLDILKETRRSIADIIFNYAAQTHFTNEETFKLLDYLSSKAKLDGDHLDYVSTTLLISFFYVIDVSCLQDLDDNDKQLLSIPWAKDPSLLLSKLEKTEFKIKPIKNICQFSLAVSIKVLSLYPTPDFNYEIDEDKLFDSSFEDKIFDNFNRYIALNANIFKEEFYVRRIHNIFCDFIVNMSGKLKELRDKADESERILNAFTAEAIKPFSSLSLEFDKFLQCLANFYLADTYGQANDFWINMMTNGKATPMARQQFLHKFLRSLHESFFPQVLHASVINFFRALARSSPFNVFNMIKTTSFHTSIQFSISSFSDLLNQYLNTVRGSDNKDRISAGFFSSHLPLSNMTNNTNKMLTETATVCAIVKLIEEIVKNDRTCCQAIAESQQYLFIPTLVGILRCAVPRELKADILTCFAAFAKVPSVSTLIWKEIDNILPRFNVVLGRQKLCQNGIAIEIEEIEVKNEEYPITIGFLELMNVLFGHYEAGVSAHQKALADNCFSFILDSILLKSIYRVFKNENEKWIIVRLCYRILANIVKKGDANGSDGLSGRAFNVFSELLKEGHLFGHVIQALEDIIHYHQASLALPSLKDQPELFTEVEEAGITIISLLTLVCERQDIFFEMIRKVQGMSVSTFITFDVLFNNINDKTTKQDRLAVLLRLIPFSTSISIEVLKFLTTLCECNFELTYLCLMQVHNATSAELKSEVLISNFVECLESNSKELRQETLRFIDTFLGSGTGASYSSKYNFAHKLVGIESKLFSLKNINLFGQNYTCLHSILSLFDNTMSLADVVEERRLGMKIIYKLCSSVHTHELILRFLRSSYDFNSQYLKFWAHLGGEQSHDEAFIESLLVEMSYFMKILAIDIHITSEQKLKSYYSTYINFLFKETKKPRIIDFLYSFIFSHHHPEIAGFDYFDMKELKRTIDISLNPTDRTIDLPLLHQRLYNEIHALDSQIGVGSTGILREEINKIMLYCSSFNKSINTLKQKAQYLESWCELVQVIILCKCLDTFEEEVNSRYLTEINIELINKVLATNTNEAMFSSISSTVLIASYSLHEIRSQNAIVIYSVIRSILQALESSSTIWSEQKKVRINFYCGLLYLFRLLPSNLFKELKFSSNLLDKLTKDVLSGHEVAKMLSISILNFAEPSNWLQEMIMNGTLKQMLRSLLSDDREIRVNKYEPIRAFYVFESKIVSVFILWISCF